MERVDAVGDRRASRMRRLAVALLAVVIALVIALVVLTVAVSRWGSRQDVPLPSLVPTSEVFVSDQAWAVDKEVANHPGLYLSAENFGKSWQGYPGRLVMTIYRYRNPMFAKFGFWRYNPSDLYCDPGECDRARPVDVVGSLRADSSDLTCIEHSGVCSRYVYSGRFGQYVVEFKYRDGLTGVPPNDADFAKLAASVDGYVDSKLR